MLSFTTDGKDSKKGPTSSLRRTEKSNCLFLFHPSPKLFPFGTRSQAEMRKIFNRRLFFFHESYKTEKLADRKHKK